MVLTAWKEQTTNITLRECLRDFPGRNSAQRRHGRCTLLFLCVGGHHGIVRNYYFNPSLKNSIFFSIWHLMWMGYMWSSHKRNRALLHFIYVAISYIYVMNWCKTLSLSLYIYSLAVIVNGLVYLDSVFNSGPLAVAPLSRFGLMSSFPDLHCFVVESYSWQGWSSDCQ